MTTLQTSLPEPILLMNLPLPKEVAEEVDQYCRSCGYTGGERAAVEEEFKLSLHYGGRFVIATTGPNGLEIHAIDLDNPDEVNELTRRLLAQGYRHVHCLFPAPWTDPGVSILTVNPQS
jgi:hypothetical protein